MMICKLKKQVLDIRRLVLVVSLAFPLVASAVCDNSVAESAPATHFTNHRDGTVTDETTGLMWSLCLYGQGGSDCTGAAEWTGDWGSALQELDDGINYGYLGYSDWRLPNVKELASILESQCTNPALNPGVFPSAGAGATEVWTSSPDMVNAQNIWVVGFNTNGDISIADRTLSKPVRIVRDADASSGAAIPCCAIIGKSE